MIIQPHKIKTPFFTRILKSSFKLAGKNPTAWVFFVVIVFLATMPFTLIPDGGAIVLWELLLKIFIGVWLVLLGVEFSGQIDYNNFRVYKIWKYMLEAGLGTASIIKMNIGYLITTCLIILVLSFIIELPSNNVNPNGPLLYLHLIAETSLVMFFGVVFLNFGKKFFYFQIMRVFNPEDKKIAANLSARALDINPKIKTFAGFDFLVLVLFMPIYGFVVGVPFLLPFIPLIMYMIFKEVFLNKGIEEMQGKQVHTQQKNSNLGIGTATGLITHKTKVHIE